MFERSDTKLLGCFLLTPRVFRDTRGTFVKTFMSTAYNEMGLTTEWAEDFWSVSSRGVLRGMHFQLPPHAHAKTVTCLEGQIFDAVLDLRAGSPTFGMHQTFYLDANAPVVLFIPRGLAHGFQALSESALVLYKAETVQAPNAEAGILWSSCGIAWPLPPVISARDGTFEALSTYMKDPKFEILRKDPLTPDIPYDWALKNG